MMLFRLYVPILLFFGLNTLVFAQLATNSPAQSVKPDANEPDSMVSPQLITPDNSWISRTIHENDTDWFSFTVDSDRELIIETKGDMDTYMVLYDAQSGNELASDDDGGDEGNSKIDYINQKKTSYLVKVTSFSNETTGSYQFQARTETLARDISEPNDTRSQATTITLGIPANGIFQSAADIDWYRVTVPAGGGQLVVYTEGSRDTYIELWSGADEKLAEDDDSGANFNAQAKAVVPAGIFYIKVTELEGYLGRYTLNARVQEPPKPDSYENDNTPGTAKPIALGAPQEHTFSDASDIDWVRFTITQAGSYEIRCNASDSLLDSYLELYDANENSIAENDDDGDSLNARIRQRLEPGTYLIKVRTLSSDPLADNRYTLRVSLVR
ncbi:putative tyrosinase [Treponema primitia ZAS-2]|uniref:Putative tyrosinase n=1 Tax=Treponema primitia (strain ATCC BAA-887 / DSM 12427 / ZAS-2) TaxID=545694 RepID=F5YHP5_TREPZ|nr:PPC domain-containing protein [Treponema primitia]AEF83579.1 putative tyrosinase [Treponema primitia ZAS-2]